MLKTRLFKPRLQEVIWMQHPNTAQILSVVNYTLQPFKHSGLRTLLWAFKFIYFFLHINSPSNRLYSMSATCYTVGSVSHWIFTLVCWNPVANSLMKETIIGMLHAGCPCVHVGNSRNKIRQCRNGCNSFSCAEVCVTYYLYAWAIQKSLCVCCV